MYSLYSASPLVKTEYHGASFSALSEGASFLVSVVVVALTFLFFLDGRCDFWSWSSDLLFCAVDRLELLMLWIARLMMRLRLFSDNLQASPNGCNVQETMQDEGKVKRYAHKGRNIMMNPKLLGGWGKMSAACNRQASTQFTECVHIKHRANKNLKHRANRWERVFYQCVISLHHELGRMHSGKHQLVHPIWTYQVDWLSAPHTNFSLDVGNSRSRKPCFYILN